VENFAQIGRLSVAHSLHAFVEREALPGTGISVRHSGAYLPKAELPLFSS
jgi:hypothetical protein